MFASFVCNVTSLNTKSHMMSQVNYYVKKQDFTRAANLNVKKIHLIIGFVKQIIVLALSLEDELNSLVLLQISVFGRNE